MIDAARPVNNPILVSRLIDTCTRSRNMVRITYDKSEGMSQEFRDGSGELLETAEHVLDLAMNVRTQGDVTRCIEAVNDCQNKAAALYSSAIQAMTAKTSEGA